MCPVKIQIFPGRIKIAKDAKLHYAEKEDSEQTVWMYRLISVSMWAHMSEAKFSHVVSYALSGEH